MAAVIVVAVAVVTVVAVTAVTVVAVVAVVAELLKVEDVQTHVCAKLLSICAIFVFLNSKQEEQALFYDFGTI